MVDRGVNSEHDPSDPDDSLVPLLEEYFAAREAGSPFDLEEFLAARPQRAEELREWIASFERIDEALEVHERRLDAGVVIDDFRIVRELGRGGMGVVYEAIQISLSRRVALKVLSFPAPTQELRDRFRQEPVLAARSAHPGIVGVIAVGTFGDLPYFVMELVIGAPLSSVLAAMADLEPGERTATALRQAILAEIARRFGNGAAAGIVIPEGGSTTRSFVDEVCRIFAEVADSLAIAHASGVVHRDVKPSNILVRGNGSAVLTDFGLARDESAKRRTLTGDFAGTPDYVSPEQAAGRWSEVDVRSDVFSLAASLYEALTLACPFSSGSSFETLRRVIEVDPRPLRRVNPEVTAELEAVVLRALEKDPARRHASAASFASDLRAVVRGEPTWAKPPGILERVQRWSRRHARVLAVGLLLATTTLALTNLRGIRSDLRTVRAAYDIRAALDQGASPTSSDLERLATILPDPDSRLTFLRNPRDDSAWREIDAALAGMRGVDSESEVSESGAVSFARVSSPRGTVLDRDPALRFEIAPQLLDHVRVAIQLIDADGERFECELGPGEFASGSIGVTRVLPNGLTPGEAYRFRLVPIGDPDPSLSSVFEDPGLAFRVATDAERARITQMPGTGDAGLDAVLRATVAATLGCDEDVLESLDAAASRIPDDLEDYAELLRGGAAVRLGRYDIAARARAGVSSAD